MSDARCGDAVGADGVNEGGLRDPWARDLCSGCRHGEWCAADSGWRC